MHWSSIGLVLEGIASVAPMSVTTLAKAHLSSYLLQWACLPLWASLSFPTNPLHDAYSQKTANKKNTIEHIIAINCMQILQRCCAICKFAFNGHEPNYPEYTSCSQETRPVNARPPKIMIMVFIIFGPIGQLISPARYLTHPFPHILVKTVKTFCAYALPPLHR